MARYVSKRSSAEASTAKYLGNRPPVDKTLWLEPATRFYEIEDVYETEKGEEAEILVVYDSSLAASKQ